ncbi:MAG: flagellar protein FlaG [Marinobacter sp.]
MSDMKLYSPGLKLPHAGDQASGVRQARRPIKQDSSEGTQVVEQSQRVRFEAQPQELGGAVARLNDYVQNVQRDLQFEVDMERGQTIVRVVDNETQEVIRQIPDEVALRLADNLQQDEPLTLFHIKV